MVDGVATVRLDHPPVNAFDIELLDAIVAAMGHLAGPVVVAGAGKCFLAGVDLRAIVGGGSEYTDRFITSLCGLARCIRPPRAGGCCGQRACHCGRLRVRHGRRRAPDVRRHHRHHRTRRRCAVPDGRAGICRYAMGTSATRAALLADTIDVAAASARGWIDEVVAPADLIPPAIAVARELRQRAPTAYAATKEQLHRPARTAIDADREGNRRRRCGRQLDVGRHARPHHRVYRRACTRLMTQLRARMGCRRPTRPATPVAENAT